MIAGSQNLITAVEISSKDTVLSKILFENEEKTLRLISRLNLLVAGDDNYITSELRIDPSTVFDCHLGWGQKQLNLQ